MSTHFIALHRDLFLRSDQPDEPWRISRGAQVMPQDAWTQRCPCTRATSKLFFSSPNTTMLETLRGTFPARSLIDTELTMRPFKIDISQDALDDLRRRLENTRW